jgi:phospholipid/cholesterol/gamma-HCH transport system permease protein
MLKLKDRKYTFSRGLDEYFKGVHKAYRFTMLFFKEVFTRPFHLREVISQSYEAGLKSLALISLTGFIIGIVFTKQSRPSLEDFGATSWLPSLIGIAIVKALGPLVTALICAGKIGSGIGAELGSMKVTEQIDAMEVSAINPYKYLVVTRVMATTIMIPLLALYCSFVALYGSYLNVQKRPAVSSVFIKTPLKQSLSMIYRYLSSRPSFMDLLLAWSDVTRDSMPSREPGVLAKPQTRPLFWPCS